jgi:lysophospholipase L1-like esterase
LNRGIGGQTSPQMLIRFKQDAIHLNPELIIINAGTNDIAANTGPASPEMIIDNICSMAEIGLKNDIRIALSTILPVYKYPWNEKVTNVPDRILEINTALQKYSEKHSLIFIDYFSSMVDEQRGLKLTYGVDGVHPTKQGYEEMSNVVKNTISGTL